MAANMRGMQVQGTTVAGTVEKGGGIHRPQIAIPGLLVAILVALLIGGATMHERRMFSPASPVVSRMVTSEQQRFLEANTTWMPVVAAPTIVTNEQQRFLEANTITLPTIGVRDTPQAVVTNWERAVSTPVPLESGAATGPYPLRPGLHDGVCDPPDRYFPSC